MSADTTAVREITDDELARFRENGWVHLRELVDPQIAEEMRALVASLPRPGAGATGRTDYQERLFLEYAHLSRRHEVFRSIAHSPQLARNASRLMRGNPDVKLFVDEVLLKESVTAKGANKPTGYHQDAPSFPIDRSGTLSFWIALVDVPPEMGSMRFFNGSHRFGTLGKAFVRPGDELDQQHPWLKEELTLSDPIHMRAGDATVHDFLTVHGAPANQTDQNRWSYSVTYMPATGLYTGMPNRFFDGLGLTIDEPVEHPNFPRIATG